MAPTPLAVRLSVRPATLLLVGIGLVSSLISGCADHEKTASAPIEETNTRTSIAAQVEVPEAPAAEPMAPQARAKQEEGRVAAVREAQGSPARTRASLDQEVSENAGVLGALRDDQLQQELGGLIGASGTQVGSAGLGIRGQGSGGGGAAVLGAPARGPYPAVATALPDPVATTETYTNYGVNDMTLTEKDALSTFSIDVDTASYTVARRKLQDGALPPAASVRVEEFVNYFPYTYANAAAGAPFAVDLEAAPSPWQPDHHIVRVGVHGRETPKGQEKPRRLTFLVDVSGSMQSADKIGLAKQSLHYLVDHLGPEDSVALVTYAGSTRVVLPATPITRRDVVHDAIEQLTAGGSTAMSSGIDLAYEQAMSAYVSGAENRVLVLSDGDANVGPTSHEQILQTITRYSKKGVTLSTFGFGTGNYKDTLMEQLADKGDGNYAYVDSYQEAKHAFGDRLQGTLDTIARDVKIQVNWKPDAVLSYRLVGYENRDIADKDFRNDKVDAGEIGSGHTVTAIYDVILRDDALNKGAPLASVNIRAKKPGPDVPAQEWTTNLTAAHVKSEWMSTSKDTRIALGAASFAELMRKSPYVGELSYAEVWRMVDGAQRKGVAEDRELRDLVAQAGALSGQSGPWGPVADR